MAPLKILICGGGCGGPALAYWLARSGHQVVIVERFPALRASGAQIDLRAQGIEVVRRMQLLETVRGKRVHEEGMSFVDARGAAKATIMANTSGKGAQTMTSEYEIMRGDLVRTLYEATKDNVRYVFGTTVESFEQDEREVVVRFSGGTSDTYDILVGADGQGSRIRKAILPPELPEPYLHLGVHMAYWFVPREEGDSSVCEVYHASKGRMIMRRSHNDTETQAYFLLRDDSPDTRLIHRACIEQQKQFWSQRFRGAGWHGDRFLKSLETTDNFYCQEVVQVRTDTWYKGRVVLLGDAAHCPSPMSGMGTTSAFVGAYVLAAEISQHPQDLSTAFANYNHTMRPFVHKMQKISPTFVRLILPTSKWGVAVLHFIVWLACFLRLPYLATHFSSAEEERGWKLPSYPILGTTAEKSG